MARLPTFEQLGQTPAPQPGMGVVSDRSGTQDNDIEGRALVGLGNSLQQASNELFAFKEKTDTIKVEDAWNQYKNAAIDLTMGETGLLKTKGGDAVNADLIGTSTKVMDDAKKRIAETLTDDQKRRFGERAMVTDMDTKKAILSHLAQQQGEYAKTVFQGSEAAAKAQVAAAPTDPGVWTGAKDTLLAQADQYFKQNGLDDEATKTLIRNKLTDSLWSTRINALLYSQPALADALFRANEKDIKDPELRLVLQSKTREVAMAVTATNEAQALIDRTRAAAPPAWAIEDGMPTGGVFQTVVGSLLRREGGYVAKDGKSGAPANFGINQKYNPDVDVKNLTKEGAIAIYKDRYWNKIDGDNLAPATALVALDTAALQGPDVANRLIEATNGDPKAMIAARREQLAALAKKDPEQAKNLPGWTKRLDGLEAEVAAMPPSAYRKVSMDDRSPLTQNTSGLPNSRDIAAQLPMMLSGVTKRADELYGTDQGNPDRAAFIKRMTSELQAKVSQEVQALNSIQRQAQGDIIDAILGGRTGETGGTVQTGGAPGPARAMVTSFSQVQADPKLMRSWQLLDPQAKTAALNMMERNLRVDDRGDIALFRDLFNRIHLDDGNPDKINFYQQIVDPKIADRLSMQQITQLRTELDRNETPGGRSFNQLRKGADKNVELYFKTTPMFTAQPDRQIAATMRWNEDAGKKIDDYVKAGKDVRSLFMLDTPDSIVSPQYLQTYVNSTPAQGLAEGAAAVKAGASPVNIRQAPSTIKTPADAAAWIKTLPPEVTMFIDSKGQMRTIPDRATAPTRGETAEKVVQQPLGVAPVMTDTGKIATPAAQPAVEQEIQMPTLVEKETQAQRRERLKQEADIRNTDAGVAMVGAVAGAAKGAVKGIEAVGRAGMKVGTAVADVAEAMNPGEQQRVLSSFRTMIKTGTYNTASEPIIIDAIGSGMLTGPEQRVAAKMLKAIQGKRK